MEVFWRPLWRREGLSGRKPWVHFPWGKPEWYFPFWKTRGVFPIWKPRSVSAGCIVVALYWQWSVVFPVHLLVSSGIPRHPLGDYHWDCSCDRPVDVSAAAIAWADFFLSLFSFFFILLYIFLDCCWSACWFACWSTVVDCAGSPYFVGFFEGRLLVDLLVEDFVACLLLSVLIMKMEMPTKPRI